MAIPAADEGQGETDPAPMTLTEQPHPSSGVDS